MSYKKHTTKTERRIAKRLIKEILKQGYVISVHDDDQFIVCELSSVDQVKRHLATTWSNRLYFAHPGTVAKQGKWNGWFQLVWGNNEGLITNCSANVTCNEIVRRVSNWIEIKLRNR